MTTLESLTRCVPDNNIPIRNLFGREKVTIKINRNVFDRWLEEKNCIEIVEKYSDKLNKLQTLNK